MTNVPYSEKKKKKLDQTVNDVVSVQTGKSRCAPSSAVLRKPAHALKVFLSASTVRLNLD